MADRASADGDFTAAVEFVLKTGKKVYVASPGRCYALGQVTQYITSIGSPIGSQTAGGSFVAP